MAFKLYFVDTTFLVFLNSTDGPSADATADRI